jgi:3-oxoadipate enol-lactonase/4-carboxymuconolactone decarboxylase
VSALRLAAVRTPGPDGAPTVVMIPSLGTAVRSLAACVSALAEAATVVVVDLPGHGRSPAIATPRDGAGPVAGSTEDATDGAVDVADIADAVYRLTQELGVTTFAVAGVSLGGAVGLELALRRPEAVTSLAVICSAARIGGPAGWRDRARAVRAQGTSSLVEASVRRWFAPGFVETQPELVGAMLHDLATIDDESYARCCEALATFDATERVRHLVCPTLVMAGEYDAVVPPVDAVALAETVPRGRVTVVRDAGHLAPTEKPLECAAALVRHLAVSSGSVDPVAHDRGMRVRREVLGDAHVDAAAARIDATTRDFQDFITRYAWGEIWSRPGLERRARSIVTLTALVAGGNLAELGMHVRAALRIGLAPAEITEVLLQCAVYCGVPRVNEALAVVQPILAESSE